MRRLIEVLLKSGMIAGLLLTVGLAWVVPAWGAKGGWLHTEATGKAAVFLIFLLQGLSLPTETLRRGLLALRLHVVVQAFIFGAMPLLAWGMTLVAGSSLDPSLRMGFLYLGLLPTTIATAVALTAQAGGNVTGALFNTCFSNVAGVFVVPLGAMLWARMAGATVPVGALLAEIATLLLLPLVVGQCLRPWLKRLVDRVRRWVRRVNSFLILFIVFAAFSNSVQSGVWAQHGAGVIAGTGMGAAFLLGVATLLAAGAARAAGLDPADRIAAIYCSSQKTIAAGIPMAQSIFAGSGFSIGVLILPLMFYHVLQLTLGVLLIDQFRGAAPSEA